MEGADYHAGIGEDSPEESEGGFSVYGCHIGDHELGFAGA
jgi:hypothetical protein